MKQVLVSMARVCVRGLQNQWSDQCLHIKNRTHSGHWGSVAIIGDGMFAACVHGKAVERPSYLCRNTSTHVNFNLATFNHQVLASVRPERVHHVLTDLDLHYCNQQSAPRQEWEQSEQFPCKAHQALSCVDYTNPRFLTISTELYLETHQPNCIREMWYS